MFPVILDGNTVLQHEAWTPANMSPNNAHSRPAFPNETLKAPPTTSIDRRGAERVVPLKVLCLGCSRTGTATLRNALLRLGYVDAYHGFSVTMENPLDGKLWLEAQCPRVNKTTGKVFDRKDFDQVLGHCQAAADFPATAFSEELMRMYPDAKVILTTRNEDKWVKSMQMLYHSFANPSWRLRKMWANLVGNDWKYGVGVVDQYCVDFYGEDLETEGRAKYREQNELVRRVCAETPGRLLEWNVEEGDSWEKLCDFLGESIPDCEFPAGNDAKAYWKRMEAHEKFMGREWKARRILSVIDHPVLSAGVVGAMTFGVYKWLSMKR